MLEFGDTNYVFLVRFMNEKTYECSRRILDFGEFDFLFVRVGAVACINSLSMHLTKEMWSSYLLDCD